ncbi:hypothetical protein Syun_014382 [Stephania yunnanensis]|uniref:DNA polymerase n=2 Tax=Magnoliopsida TaxID=3398 RepID=A0AAP0P8P6_9MAGN
MNNGGGAKRRGPPAAAPPKRLHQEQPPPTPSAAMDEDDMMDEDVFLDETLLHAEDEEAAFQIHEEEERRKVIAFRHDKWRRPPLSPSFLSQSCNIVFQQLEIDYVIGESHKELVPNSSGPAAILRIFGVTREGHSVCCKVHGFEPYFYIGCLPGMGPDDISRLHQTLEARMKEANRNSKAPKFIKRIEMMQKRSIMHYQQQQSHPFLKIVVALPTMARMKEANRNSKAPKFIKRIEMMQKRSIMHYQQQQSHPFLKIVVALPTMVAGCRGILERGIHVDGLGMRSFMTYESNVLFALRFMIDCNIVGGNWIEVPAGKYKKTIKPMSYCQLEYSELISHASEGEFSKIAPFRILSFDIECAGRKGLFPDPSHDPVIQDFIQEVDPDIIIGYNIIKFDLPYLIERAEVLKVAEFPILGRIRNSRVRVRDATFSSRQYGTRESKEVTIEGRVQFDLLQAMQRDYKLSSYSLNSVSAHFLGEQKEDVHHSIISDLQNGNPETRRRLAVYCLKDAYLPQRLLDKLMFIYNYVEMARVTGVPISFLLSRGQSIKVLSQLLRKAKQKNLLIPSVKKQGSGEATFEGATVLEAKTGFYEKPIATLDFASLYPSIMMAYNLCYCTLVKPEDVRKLNLPPGCVNKTPSGETFVKSDLQKGILPEILEELLTARKRAKADLKEAKDPLEKAVLDGRQLALKISANSVYGFTGATVAQLPCLEISSSVTSYGRQMIEHTKKLVGEKFTTLNGYEHNAEVIYGDTDSVMVQFGVPTVEEAMKLGREAAEYISCTFNKPIKLEFEKVYFPYLLISKKRYAGLFWTNPNKYDKMDTKGIETVRRDNCLLVKNLVTECLHKILIDRDIPGAVQYVKDTISDLLMNRMDLSLLVITKGLTKTGDDYAVKAAHVELAERMRKFAAMFFAPGSPNNFTTWAFDGNLVVMDSNGISTNIARSRRKANRGEATRFGEFRVEGHEQRWGSLVASFDYPSTHFFRGMKLGFDDVARDAATAPNVGDRVPYVIIKAAKGAKAYERSEDPIYVLENNIPIDTQYYLENQISKPLLRIFEPILKNASKELLHGSHTRAVSISTPSNSGIMKFAKKQLSCIGCKAVLRHVINGEQTVCSHCKGREAELYCKTVANVAELEKLFGRLWTQCQECQGSLHQDVLCTSRDCPIFYRRKKAQKDMAEAKASFNSEPTSDLVVQSEAFSLSATLRRFHLSETT